MKRNTEDQQEGKTVSDTDVHEESRNMSNLMKVVRVEKYLIDGSLEGTTFPRK